MDDVVDVVPAVPAGLAAPVATRLIPRPQPKIKAHIKDILTLFPEGAMCMFAGPLGPMVPWAAVGKGLPRRKDEANHKMQRWFLHGHQISVQKSWRHGEWIIRLKG